MTDSNVERNKLIKVPVLLDEVRYLEKPKDKISHIITRLAYKNYKTKELRGPTYLSMKGVHLAFLNGANIRPGVGKGTSDADCYEYQLFLVDIDEGMSIVESCEKYRKAGIEPFGMYRSFSFTEENQKHRLEFCANRLITDGKERDKIYAVLISLLGEKFNEKTGKFEPFVDTKCKARSHYFNGTNKGGEFFGYYTFDVDYVLSLYTSDMAKYLPNIYFVESNEKKSSGNKTKRSNKENTDSKIIDLKKYKEVLENDVEVREDWRKKSKWNLEALDRFFPLRAWKEGDHRENFIFACYNCALASGMDYDAAIALIEKYNEKMLEPISETRLAYNIENTNNHIESSTYGCHGDGVFVFYRDTLASSKWLDITKEESTACNFKGWAEIRENADKWRDIKHKKYERIKELYLQGHRKSSITKILKEEFPELEIKESSVKSYYQDHKEEWELESKLYEEGVGNCNITTSSSSSLSNTSDICGRLNIEQQEIYNTIMLGNNVTILAKAGCGKTYVVSKAIESLREMNKCVGFCAATGVAAQALDGCTVHHMFGIYANEENYNPSAFVTNTLYDYDVIFIDEVGMLDASTFGKVVKAIQYMQANYNHNIQLVLIGDVLQLESVEGTYFFESPYFNQLNSTILTLNTNMRQSNGVFDRLVSNLREGVDVRNTIRNLNAICSFEEDRSAMYVYANKSRVYFKNNEILSTIEGDFIRLDPYLSVKIGARVVVTENARNGKYYNGMVGILKRVRSNSVVIEVKDGIEVVIKKQNMAINEDELYEGYPLTLGYAMTIHKVQGMTFDSLNIHPSCFACGQLYTALSRVRTLSGVHLLAPIKEKDVKVNQVALSFVRGCMGLDMAM